MIKLTVDHQADALYLSLSEAPAARTEEVAPGIMVDYDEDGQVVGIEMLDLSKHAPNCEPQRLVFELLPHSV